MSASPYDGYVLEVADTNTADVRHYERLGFREFLRVQEPNHPWTNGQVERMNRTLKEATVNRYYYQNHQQLQEYLDTFLCAYNFAKRLKSLLGLTTYQFILERWADSPGLALSDPSHLYLGLYI